VNKITFQFPHTYAGTDTLFCSYDLNLDPMTFISYKRDTDILKHKIMRLRISYRYLHIEMNFLCQGFQRLELRQTDGQTNATDINTAHSLVIITR